ncbi:MAG: serine/threonine-protein kinase [Kofleriaceae bacterium]
MTAAVATRFFCPRCGAHGPDGACSRDGTPRVEVVAGSLLGATIGNYVIVRLLGEGGMGSVYRAVQPEIGAEVAIKVLHATPTSHAGAVQRFMLEAQAVNRVRHPGLIRILDTGFMADRRPYLVMELLDGISLAEVCGRLGAALACHVACEALAALEAVHEQGVVHRDLKPANLFLGRDGRVVVLDFGIAKLVDADGVAQTHSTGLIGTPEYMAPEQIRAKPLDRRTDVYAMGIVLYETVTGRRPFAAAATFDMLVQHLERPPTPPRELRPGLAPAIDAAIVKALAKEPVDRYQTAAELATALRAAIGPIGKVELAAFVESRAPAQLPVPQLTPKRRSEQEAPATNAARDAETVFDKPKPVRRWLAIAGVIAVLGACAFAWTFLLVRHDPPSVVPDAAMAITPIVAQPIEAPIPPPPPARPGTLVVESEPAGAAIAIDDGETAPSPLEAKLAPGIHRVHLSRPGYRAQDKTIDIRADERQTVIVSLEKLREVRPRPADAAYVDDLEKTPPSLPPPPTVRDGGMTKPNPYR